MKKRIISFFLTAAMMLSIMPTSSAAIAPDSDEIFKILNVLGWMTPNAQGNFYGSTDVTRAALAKIIITSSSTYRATISTTQKTSPFKDVKYTFWGAPYISAVAQAGLMYGYSDGSFRPNKGVLYEEAVTAILRVLGYSDSDYIGSYPTGQLAFANDLELTDGISATRGQIISRYDMSRLLYNALSVTGKTSNGKIYAETLGYSRATEMLRLNDFVKDTVNGPVTYLNTSIESLTGLSNPTVYINGSNSSLSAIKAYDVIYYSKQSNTIWVYTEKATGILEAITPNKEYPSSVTIGGKTYSLDYSKSRTAFGLDGLETGTLVTALLDKDGKIYDAYEADKLYSTQLGIVTNADTKQVTLSGGVIETRYYITVLLINGNTVEIERDTNSSSMLGKAVEINYRDGSVKTHSYSSSSPLSSISGTINSETLLWGTKTILSKDIKILEIDEYGNYTTLSLNRLNGVYLKGSQVALYSKNSAGAIDGLILKNVCGDTAQFGHVTSSSVVSSGGMPVGINYKYTLTTGSGSGTIAEMLASADNGPAAFYFKNGQLQEIRNLTRVSEKINTLNYSYLETSSGVKHRISPSVIVYKVVSGTRTQTTIDEAVSGNWNLAAYYDEVQADGGMIRMIYIEAK